MAWDKDCLYFSYLYTALIELVYFIVIYIECRGFVKVSTVANHVMFFKNEVSQLLSTYSGSSLDEKLNHFLTDIQCFTVKDNNVFAIAEIGCLKKSIFEDLIIIKTTDLILRKCANLKDICENLNLCNVISIDSTSLMRILRNTSHFSIQKNNFVSLNHLHGIFGFEPSACTFVINYFQDILQHTAKFPLSELKYHLACISSCGINHVLPVLCVLHSCEYFQFKDGFIIVCKNAGSCDRERSKYVDLQKCQNRNGAVLTIAETVYLCHGCRIQGWVGEICGLRKTFGCIDCVSDLSDGNIARFKVHFNASALKILSETLNLKKVLQIQDKVKFDAIYHHYKDKAYWMANKIEIIGSSEWDYDTELFEELKTKTLDFERKCSKSHLVPHRPFCNKKCFYLSYAPHVHTNKEKGNGHDNTLSIKNVECSNEKCYNNPEDLETQFDSKKMVNSSFGKYQNNHPVGSLIPSNLTLYTTRLINYIMTFGHLVLLMEDKGILIAQVQGEMCHIIFMKSSVYPAGSCMRALSRGQKVFALIPYIDKFDDPGVATLIYVLDNDETLKFHDPAEFAEYFISNSEWNDISESFIQTKCNSNANLYETSVRRPMFSGPCYEPALSNVKAFQGIIKAHCSFSGKETELLVSLKSFCKEQKNWVFKDVLSFLIILARRLKRMQFKSKLLSSYQKFNEFSPITKHKFEISNNSMFNEKESFKETVGDTSSSEKFCEKSQFISEVKDRSCNNFKSLQFNKSSDCKFDENFEHKQEYELPKQESSDDRNSNSPITEKILTPLEEIKKYVFSLENYVNPNPGNKAETSIRREKSKYPNQLSPVLKPTIHKKGRLNILKTKGLGRDEDNSEFLASLTLITHTLLFFEIDKLNLLLPFPKSVLEELGKEVALRSLSELTVSKHRIKYFSQIVSMKVLNQPTDDARKPSE